MLLTTQPRVGASVGGENAHLVELTSEQVPADLEVMQLSHRTMYIENNIYHTNEQDGRLDHAKRAIRLHGVLLADRAPIEASRVERLGLTGVVQRDDHPVCVAAVTRLIRRVRFSSDGVLSERNDVFRNPVDRRLRDRTVRFTS